MKKLIIIGLFGLLLACNNPAGNNPTGDNPQDGISVKVFFMVTTALSPCTIKANGDVYAIIPKLDSAEVFVPDSCVFTYEYINRNNTLRLDTANVFDGLRLYLVG